MTTASKIFIKDNGFSFVGDEFLKLYGSLPFDENAVIKSSLVSDPLPAKTSPESIKTTMSPDAITLEELFYTLKGMGKESWGLFFVTDINGVANPIGVDWFDGGWYINTEYYNWDKNFEVYSYS